MCSASELVVLVATLFVGYTYAGYPAWCWLRARGGGRGIVRGTDRPRVTVVIAAYREKKNIAQKIESLARQSYSPDDLDVVIVCDGSDDGTASEAREAAERHMPGRVRVVDKVRGGKPSALNLAVEHALGEVIVMTDARQPLSNDAVLRLVENLGDETVGVVGGTLELAGGAPAGAYWRYEAFIRKQEARVGSTMGVSGALYAMRRKDFVPIPPETILDDVWVPMRLHLRDGRRIALEPGAIAYDLAAETQREFGRKARTLSGNFQLLAQLPRLLSPYSNPSFFAFLSHKMFRLFVPYALVAIAVASFFVRSPLKEVLLAGQGLCYGLAALGGWGVRARAAQLCHTFVVLNAAAVVGLVRFVRHGRRLPW